MHQFLSKPGFKGGTPKAGRDRVELLLAIGATRWEATRETVGRSVRVACTPILNQMNVVGLVSIPGMMTGQILSGSDPSQANHWFMLPYTWKSAWLRTGSATPFKICDCMTPIR